MTMQGRPFSSGHLVDLADERVIEGGSRTRFAEQLVQRVAPVRRRRQELEGDLSVEHQVVGKADLRHSTPSDGLDDAVAGTGRGSRWHDRCSTKSYMGMPPMKTSRAPETVALHFVATGVSV